MQNVPGSMINCPNCRQPFQVRIEQVIDVGRDPQAKARFLSGRTNLAICPNCHYQVSLGTPIVYHDPTKQLLLTYIPMELNLPRQEQERVIGSMVNAVINALPQEQRKAYLLTPRTMLTMQGLMETILEADGITKEVLEKQRQKVRLVEKFLQTPPAQLADLVKQHDGEIDEEFFNILTSTAESAAGGGQRQVAEAMLALRDHLLGLTTAGQAILQQAGAQQEAIQNVAQRINALGENATHEQLVDLIIQLADEGGDEYLQVVVGLVRPALDYQFFQTLSARAESETDADIRDALLGVRDRLVELTGMVDQQNQEVVEQAKNVLRAILNSPDPQASLAENADLIDDTFLAVLSANIRAAEEAGDINNVARMKGILEMAVSVLRDNMPPAVQFINELMSQSPDAAHENINRHAPEFGRELIEWMDMLDQQLETAGDNQSRQRLLALRSEAVKALAVAGMDNDNDQAQ